MVKKSWILTLGFLATGYMALCNYQLARGAWTFLWPTACIGAVWCWSGGRSGPASTRGAGRRSTPAGSTPGRSGGAGPAADRRSSMRFDS